MAFRGAGVRTSTCTSGEHNQAGQGECTLPGWGSVLLWQHTNPHIHHPLARALRTLTRGTIPTAGQHCLGCSQVETLPRAPLTSGKGSRGLAVLITEACGMAHRAAFRNQELAASALSLLSAWQMAEWGLPRCSRDSFYSQ